MVDGAITEGLVLPTGAQAAPVFALLDDGQNGSAHGGASSRLYSDFADERICADPAALDAFWVQIEADLRSGLHAVLLGDYEWGVALQRLDGAGGPTAAIASSARAAVVRMGAGSVSDKGHDGEAPALHILLFRDYRRLTRAEVDTYLQSIESDALGEALPDGPGTPAPAGIAHLRADTAPDRFTQAMDAIHAALQAGDCYQINYTFRLAFDVFGHPISLYRRLRARQPVPFGALIRSRRGWTLSASPELFIRHHEGQLQAKPMKGTAARHPEPLLDAERGAALQADPKNRAENVMIVDLLRNDLGRIALPGAVSVDALFAVEAWPTVWQMTSTITAGLSEAVRFPDILRATFPCGSITGAPKRAAIEIIDALETAPRGLYTGAIGWIDAPRVHDAVAVGEADYIDPDGKAAERLNTASGERQCGDFCLSVGIRTLQLSAEPHNGVYTGGAGIGAGIVLDSRADDEYEECLLKARFLTQSDPGFALFETMQAVVGEAGEGEAGFIVRERVRHLARLASSAADLGFLWRADSIAAALDQALAALPLPGPHRVKLTLSKDGSIEITSGPLSPLATPQVSLLLASEHGFAATQHDDFLLRHKTTARAVYDRAWQAAEAHGAFDMVFTNQYGRVTEGGRSTLLVKLGGQWCTPPLSEGVLPGVIRASLLDDPKGELIERPITLDALFAAEALAISNGLRGVLPAILLR